MAIYATKEAQTNSLCYGRGYPNYRSEVSIFREIPSMQTNQIINIP